jgi:hypothetical protein
MYAPPVAQQGYPQYAPQPGYPQPGQAAPPLPAPPQPAAQPFVMPNIVEPGMGGNGGELAPLPRHLTGYAAVVLPTAHDPNNRNNGQLRPKVTVDFVVVNIAPDGSLLPAIQYGDSQARDNTARPNCLQLDVFPAEFRGVWWNNSEIVKHLAPLIESRSITMGRFRLGDSANRPPLFERMDDNDPARAVLLEAWQQRTMNPGSLKRSVGAGIIEINGGPPQKAPAAQQGMPPQPGAAYTGYAQGAPPQGYQQPAQQWGGPVAPPMPPQPGQPPAQVAYGPPPAQPGAGPAPMPAVAAQAGWTQDAWNNAPPQVKAAFGG